MFSIQDLVASVVWLRCRFSIWQITEVIVMSLFYLCFYLSVIFNIEVKVLDMHIETVDTSLWETFLQNLLYSPLPPQKRRFFWWSHVVFKFFETFQIFKGKLSVFRLSKVHFQCSVSIRQKNDIHLVLQVWMGFLAMFYFDHEVQPGLEKSFQIFFFLISMILCKILISQVLIFQW